MADKPRGGDPNVYVHPAVIERMAEDAECAHMYLDDRRVPRADASGKVFSLVGRIKAYAENPSQS